jgi:hypothetical protein
MSADSTMSRRRIDLRLRMLDVEREALLRAIGPDEMRRETVDALVVAAREIADAGPLDLDHPRAEIGELARGERRGDRVLERDDGDSFQRSHRSNVLVVGRRRPTGAPMGATRRQLPFS